MPKPIKLELRCIKNDDGTFNAGAYDDDQQLADPEYTVQNGKCKDIQAVYKRLQKAYPDVPIQVGTACAHCIPADPTS